MTLATPTAPAFAVDWPALVRSCPLLAELEGCPQDPVHHAEGDVDVHTRRCLEALVGLEAWRGLDEAGRALVFAATALHDAGKPACTKTEPEAGGVDRVSSKGHSRRGALLARRWLFERGVPPAVREPLVTLVRRHMLPFFAVERDEAPALLRDLSHEVDLRHLALVAQADALGREAPDLQKLLDGVELFRELAREHECLAAPFAFPSPTARFQHARTPGRDPRWAPPEPTGSDVVVLCGLPGSGKDTWVRRHAGDRPVVSLDALRETLDVDPTDDQGAVVQRAKEEARAHLRASRPFVWNATNLSRMLRDGVVSLCVGYGARVRLVHVEAPSWSALLRRNRSRERPVPEPVLERLLERWEVPGPSEAHEVEWVVSS